MLCGYDQSSNNCIPNMIRNIRKGKVNIIAIAMKTSRNNTY